MIRRRMKVVAYLALCLVIFLIDFYIAPRRPIGPINITIEGALMVYGIRVILVQWKRGNDPILLILTLVAWLVDLVAAFALIYWSYGSHPNFGPHTSLTRLDAIYFSVGTLTTGTGSINAVSEAARAVQMIQQLLDLAYIGFAAALVISRFGELKTEKRLKVERLDELMAERNRAFT